MGDDAVFDILYTLKRFKLNMINELSFDEISTLLYLSCFVGIYNGSNYADWGYKFYLTDGDLTSTQLTNSVDRLLTNNLINNTDLKLNFFEITEKGEAILSKLVKFERYKLRQKQIKCVADIVLTSSVNSVIRGVYANPELSESTCRSGAKVVLEEVGQDILFKSLKNICDKVGLNNRDAYSSTWAWLTYNSSAAQTEGGC